MNVCTRCFTPIVLIGKRFNSLSKCISVSTVACSADYHSDDSVKVVVEGTYAKLRKRMHAEAKLGDLGKVCKTLDLMRDLKGKPTVRDYNETISCYFKSANVSVANVSGLINWMQAHGPLPDRHTYTVVVNGLTSIGCLEDGILFTEKMMACSFVPSYTVLSTLHRKLVKAGNLEGSGVVLILMWNLGYTPVIRDVGSFIRDLCRADLGKMAFEVLAAASKKGNFTRGSIFNPILRSFCKYGDMYTALSFLGWLSKTGFVLDVYSYTALVHGFSMKRSWVQVNHCLNEMKRAGCKPSVVTHTVIIKSLCDDGKVDEGLQYLQEMEDEGCDPDLVPFNIGIRELGRQGRSRDIVNLVQVMDQKDLSPDRYTFVGIAGGMLKTGKVEIANVLLQNVIAKGWSIDDVVYNTYLHSVCRLNGSKEALGMVSRMMKRGFRPSNVTYNIILKGLLLSENDIEKSCRLCHHIKPVNEPDLIYFNIMLDAACKGDSDRIPQILSQMKREGIKPDVISMTYLLQYYSRIRKIGECFWLLQFMLENDCVPNTDTLNTLLVEFSKKRLLGLALEVFEYFKSIGISPNTATYNILLRASTQQHNVSLVIELLRDMYGQQVKHDIGTYGCFFNSLCESGKISRAAQFLDNMPENGMLPDTFMYNTMIKTMIERGGMPQELVLLLRRMVIDGCEPNKFTLHILRQAYKRGWGKRFPGVVNVLELALFDTGKWNNKRLVE